MANKMKRIPRKKLAAPAWRKMMPEPVAELEAAVEKRVRKGVEQVADMIPASRRKALNQVTADVKRIRRDLEKRGDKLVITVRKRAKKLTGELQKRAENLTDELQKRAENLTGELQKRVEGVLTPLVKRLDVASRSDVDRLRKRLEHVERRLETRTGRSSALA